MQNGPSEFLERCQSLILALYTINLLAQWKGSSMGPCLDLINHTRALLSLKGKQIQ